MSMEATVKNLTEDGSIIRAENHYWVFYINNETAPTLVDKKCGKWMFFFKDVSFAEDICTKAILEGAIAECKHTSAGFLEDAHQGVVCFYLNIDDAPGHHRILEFMLSNGMIPKTKKGKLHNISFKLDDQTRAGEYGKSFNAKTKLEDFVNLETGEFL